LKRRAEKIDTNCQGLVNRGNGMAEIILGFIELMSKANKWDSCHFKQHHVTLCYRYVPSEFASNDLQSRGNKWYNNLDHNNRDHKRRHRPYRRSSSVSHPSVFRRIWWIIKILVNLAWISASLCKIELVKA
jgi:hypothetical protein